MSNLVANNKKEMMLVTLRLVDRSEADLVKEFLLKAKLSRPLSLGFPGLDLGFSITGLSKPESVFEDMDGRRFTGKTSLFDAVTMRGRANNLMLMVGKWGDAARLDASHIVLSSDHSALDFRFGQLELSSCLSDGSNIYFTKSLSKDGGEGAIVRLRRGATGIAERESRRGRLADALGNNTLRFNDALWLVVSSLSLSEIKKYSSSAMTRFVTDLLRYAGQVERIRDDLDLGAGGLGEVAASAPPVRLSAEERMAVERAAMDSATAWLAEKGYVVEDVSDLRVGYDLIARMGRKSLMVEVKGTASSPWVVNLTPNEHSTAAEGRAGYLLLVVMIDNPKSLNTMDVVEVYDPIHAGGFVVRPTGYTLLSQGD